jgi:hypothetical protein
MKKLSFLFIVLWIVCYCIIAEGGEWAYLTKDEHNNTHYYNKKIIYPSKGIVGTWLKMEWSKEGKSHFINVLGKKGIQSPDLSKPGGYTVGYYKINCITHETTCNSGTMYNGDGKIISDNKFPDRWMPIDAGSLMDTAYKTFCPKNK